jgi:hypothetical protein
MKWKNLWLGAAFLAFAFLGGMAGSWLLTPSSPQASEIVAGGAGDIAGTFGVGGVVTREGKLWQYRPDKKKWVSLDESFQLEGKSTSTAPLPVPVGEIRFMETFGFLVTRSGDCWLYNFDQNRWDEVGKPPRR